MGYHWAAQSSEFLLLEVMQHIKYSVVAGARCKPVPFMRKAYLPHVRICTFTRGEDSDSSPRADAHISHSAFSFLVMGNVTQHHTVRREIWWTRSRSLAICLTWVVPGKHI